jgi:predicted RNA binding protein YcfA (HicA-like mRNA interferase family)
VPRLKCTYSEFINIIKFQGFTLLRHDASNHQRWTCIVGGTVRFVDISCHSSGMIIPDGTLQSMIRQSGLSKKLFRK